MRFVKKLVILMMLIQPMSALADRYETTRIFNHKAWIVYITHDQLNDDFWCSAETTNRSRQSFSLAAYDNGNLGFFVMDSRWELKPRDIDFRIDIDYSRWSVSGHARNNSVSTFLGDPESSIRFLTELAEGSAVAVYNNEGHRLATYSLSGSSAALRKLMKCWNSIRKTDPFGTTPGKTAPKSDPF